MRVVFAGTPPFAVSALGALIAAGHEVVLVLSQPDRPSGRGLRPTPSAVSAFALSRGIPTYCPASLRDPAAHDPIRQAGPDVLVVAAYGQILPQAVLDMAPSGAINIHASLLPRWRGAAPIARAIEAGDKETGVAIMKMEASLDTGPVLLQRRVPILETDTTGSLTERLAELGAEAIVEALGKLDVLVAVSQDGAEATYAPKISRAEARIDWSQPSDAISRKVRALNPSPGAEAAIGGVTLKIWEGSSCVGSGPPGTVLLADYEGVRVACGEQALTITKIQRAGGRRLPAGEFLRGFPLSGGAAFDILRGPESGGY